MGGRGRHYGAGKGNSRLFAFADICGRAEDVLGEGLRFGGIQGMQFPVFDARSHSYVVQSVLSVIIRNYRFALRDGPDTKIDLHRGILPRPMIAGEDGARVPLLVSRVQ